MVGGEIPSGDDLALEYQGSVELPKASRTIAKVLGCSCRAHDLIVNNNLPIHLSQTNRGFIYGSNDFEAYEKFTLLFFGDDPKPRGFPLSFSEDTADDTNTVLFAIMMFLAENGVKSDQDYDVVKISDTEYVFRFDRVSDQLLCLEAVTTGKIRPETPQDADRSRLTSSDRQRRRFDA